MKNREPKRSFFQALFSYLFVYFYWSVLHLRYSINIKGLSKLNKKHLKKKGGVLFLPNHPAEVIDPSVVVLSLFPKFSIRPLVIEYMYYMPIINKLMKFVKAIPIPNFESSNNSYKRKNYQKSMKSVVHGLMNKENILLYPAGRLKLSQYENIGNIEAIHWILEQAPETNVVLVRVKGLWGSMFSRALEGRVPPLFPTLKKAFKILLKNLIFFTPRRKVVIEFEPAPEDFPYGKGRDAINRWLENWYNRPDGLSDQEGEYPGETLQLVSYSRWRKELPEPMAMKVEKEKAVSLKTIPKDVQDKVLEFLADLAEMDRSEIKPKMTLHENLGLDSLDISQIAAFLKEKFKVGAVPAIELTTVGKIMQIASGEIEIEKEIDEVEVDLEKWKPQGEQKRIYTEKGDTFQEVFLNISEKMGNAPAVADNRSGILSYKRMRIGVVLLAERIRKMDGKYIGIMLPASAGAFIVLLACQMAGKIPLMINWTVGPKHLKAVREATGVKTVLTSWFFLERLNQVDLDGVDDILQLLEGIKLEVSPTEKIRAALLSKKSTDAIRKHFKVEKQTKHDTALLLFTSGTEALPKGVPLSHNNILSNHRAAVEVIPLYSDDAVFSFLPPFHSFGSAITGLLGLMAGARTAYFPDPTDGEELVRNFDKWKCTVMAGAPTFVKGMLKAADDTHLKTLRVCFTGAEKTPKELVEAMNRRGKEGVIVEGYGITECSPIISCNIPGKPLQGVGKPLPGVEVCIIHTETHEPVHIGKEGIILARGPNVFGGYLDPNQKSPFVVHDNQKWYDTGDIGYLDEEGHLFISGRLKRFIKVGGEMISLLAIESVLNEAADERGWEVKQDAPSLGIIAKENGEDKPKIYLITTFSVSLEEVNKVLKEKGLAQLIKISKIIEIDDIPVMGTGKIAYRKLEDEYFSEKVVK